MGRPTGGGPPPVRHDGDEISVSPNGRLIAFPRIEDGCAAGALVVRDLVSGTEKVWHPSTRDIGSVALMIPAIRPSGAHDAGQDRRNRPTSARTGSSLRTQPAARGALRLR